MKTALLQSCYLCSKLAVKTLLDCGRLPLCNRFVTRQNEEESTYPFLLGQCQACGTLQLTTPPPVAALAPTVNWITYSEPEGHLDEMSELIAHLPGLTPESAIAGISFKDDSTLERMRRKGFQHVWRLDTKVDLGIQHPGAGAESIQDRIVPEVTTQVTQARGAVDVLIVRHVLEHAHRPKVFLEGLRCLLKPGGRILFEVPDCARAVQAFDYSTLWEEHTLYFTPATFQQTFPNTRFHLNQFRIYPYAFENSLVAVVSAGDTNPAGALAQGQLQAELEAGERFAGTLPALRRAAHQYFGSFRKNQGRIAFLGAGHLACFFINLLGICDWVEFVADDNPNKQGAFMPGSRLPIVSSTALGNPDIKLCILCVNPEVEDRVVQRNQSFVARGGRFASIFPASKYALRLQP